MNKGQGFAISAVLAAALLLRPAGSGTSGEPAATEGTKSNTRAAETAGSQKGPWEASCKYWAPARVAGPSASVPPDIHASLDAKDGQVDLQVRANETDNQSGCPSDPVSRWGFEGVSGPINVTALIATVPDPVHTHFSLAFDRTIDAILQAASDNDYVSSYYWLPWKNRAVLKFTESQEDAEEGHSPERERQPGLIILKKTSVGWPAGFATVIYLFLVAETPTQGVDGFQLQNAFSYEAELRGILASRGEFSTGRKGVVAIMGPAFSGSAASLRAGIEAARIKAGFESADFEVTGITSTAVPRHELGGRSKITFQSFAANRDYDTRSLLDSLSASGYTVPKSVFLLVEDNTAAGSAAMDFVDTLPEGKKPSLINFPREISLLRNAEVVTGQSGNAASSGGGFSPYLHLSLKDYSAQDSVPQFSRENTPLSQEAQLMGIARQLQRSHAEFIVIAASNALDQIFLAQFLRRACPDARLLFLGADLLMVRDIDNVPFIGSLTITPYSLIGLRAARRAHPDSASESYYMAASYTFGHNNLGTHRGKALSRPLLPGYRSPLEPETSAHPALWATAIGRDGYYPLGILRAKASDDPNTLPVIGSKHAIGPEESRKILQQVLHNAVIYPSLVWTVIVTVVFLLCALHIGMLFIADYWSPFSRDLAIRDNDEPRRRSLYLHMGTAALFSMAFVVSFPLLWLCFVTRTGVNGATASVAALVLGIAAIAAALWKTRGYSGRAGSHPALNLLAGIALVGVAGLWAYLCCTGWPVNYRPDGELYLIGICFCYRCIHPESGVSPLVPVLLLLLAWYIWAVFQTLRLRFSEQARPRLPEMLGDDGDVPLFVSDNELSQPATARNVCLYDNITCLFITRQAVRRFLGGPAIDIGLRGLYAGALVWFFLFTPMRSLDHFLWKHRLVASPYECLVGLLFFPLLALCMAGWLRMLLIWAALKRGLLERLENMPIRFAFSRLKVTGWMQMLRYGGLQEHWRDMARSAESMRQMLNHDELKSRISAPDSLRLESANSRFLEDVKQLRNPAARAEAEPCRLQDYEIVQRIERSLAQFSRELLASVLIPYWKNHRQGLVESEVPAECPDQPLRPKTQAASSPEPASILVAEEFVAIRYLSLIRAVLANLRYLMVFTSASFVLAILAWNSYPFQPRELGDWAFTGLLAVLGLGVIWVFAQMHRNAILSRITGTRENELGLDFYLRVVSYGAVPVITWLAYQFPEVGNFISRFVQPAVPVIQ